MRRRAGFEADEARRNPRKECEDLAATQPLAHHYAAHLVGRMNLEDTRSLTNTILAHRCRQGAIHPISWRPLSLWRRRQELAGGERWARMRASSAFGGGGPRSPCRR